MLEKIINAALKIIFCFLGCNMKTGQWGHPKMFVFYVVLVYWCITFIDSFMWCPLYLTIWWMKWSGSWAANTVRVVPAGTPSSKRIVLGLTGKTGGSFTSWTEMVTPAVDWSEDWMPLARWAWLDTTTVSMKARFISKSTGWRRQRRGEEREKEITEWWETGGKMSMADCKIGSNCAPIWEMTYNSVKTMWDQSTQSSASGTSEQVEAYKMLCWIMMENNGATNWTSGRVCSSSFTLTTVSMPSLVMGLVRMVKCPEGSPLTIR